MFVDASALSAILLDEEDAERLAHRLESAPTKLTSPLAIYETVLAVSRVHVSSVPEAEERVRAFLQRAVISVEPVSDAATSLALQAHAAFGKGRGHPAQLNLCDCFAYAMAKQHGMALLYKGDDFSRTDLA